MKVLEFPDLRKSKIGDKSNQNRVQFNWAFEFDKIIHSWRREFHKCDWVNFFLKILSFFLKNSLSAWTNKNSLLKANWKHQQKLKPNSLWRAKYRSNCQRRILKKKEYFPNMKKGENKSFSVASRVRTHGMVSVVLMTEEQKESIECCLINSRPNRIGPKYLSTNCHPRCK